MAGTDPYYVSGIPATKQYEGFKPNVYTDTTGNPTVGYGFNLNDPAMRSLIPADVIAGKRPLSQQEADQIFMVRYNQAARDAMGYLGPQTMLKLDPQRQASIVDMAYNLGADKLGQFKDMRQALVSGDYNKAALAMQDSKWYKQVGTRARNHIKTMRGR